MDKSVVSLFSGAMGLDLGLEAAGLHVVHCAEIDEACRATILANKAGTKGLMIVPGVQVVTDYSAPTRPFMVAGGPPCPSFSTMGKRLSFSDPRGMLPFEFGRVVRQLQPRFFVMENVKGMLSTKCPWSDRSAADEVLANFNELGYRLVHGILMAADYGVPQFRERFVIIGSRDGEDVFLPLPTHFRKHQNKSSRYRTLRDAIWHLRDAPGDASFSPERLRFMRKIAEGGNWHDLPEEDLKPAMGGAFESGGGKTGFYRRLRWDEPSPTLVTSPAQKSTVLGHPDRDRPLSLAEYAAIQQFPESWVFEGSVSDKYRQIGNAVPIGMARAIGEAVVAVAEGGYEITSKRFT